MTTESKDDGLLTINDFRMLFAQAYSIEYALVTSSHRDDVNRFCVQLASTVRLHEFFEVKSLAGIVNTVFQNDSVRDFILALNSRFTLLTNDPSEAQFMHLARMLARTSFVNISTTGAADASLVPGPVLSAFDTANRTKSYDSSLKRLTIDRWLITVMLLYITYTEAVAQKLIEAEAAKPARKTE